MPTAISNVLCVGFQQLAAKGSSIHGTNSGHLTDMDIRRGNYFVPEDATYVMFHYTRVTIGLKNNNKLDVIEEGAMTGRFFPDGKLYKTPLGEPVIISRDGIFDDFQENDVIITGEDKNWKIKNYPYHQRRLEYLSDTGVK